MKNIIGYATRKGVVFVAMRPDGRYCPVWRGQPLGSYASLKQAISDLSSGCTSEPSDGTELRSLGISTDLGDWQLVGKSN